MKNRAGFQSERCRTKTKKSEYKSDILEILPREGREPHLLVEYGAVIHRRARSLGEYQTDVEVIPKVDLHYVLQLLGHNQEGRNYF